MAEQNRFAAVFAQDIPEKDERGVRVDNPYRGAFAADIPEPKGVDAFRAAFAEDIPPPPGIIKGVGNAVARGGYNTAAAGNVAGMEGVMTWEDKDSAARDIARHRQSGAEFSGMSRHYQGLQEAVAAEDSIGGALWEAVKRPLAMPELAAESLAYSGPGLAMAAGGAMTGTLAGPAGSAVGGALGMGKGVYETEYGNSVLEFLGQNGINLKDEASVRAAFDDEILMSKAKMYANKRATAIATPAAASMGVAGRLYGATRAAMPKRPITAAVAGSGLEAGQQALSGGGGEYLAQQWVGEDNPGEVALEAIAEIAYGAPEAAINTAAASVQKGKRKKIMAEVESVMDEMKVAQAEMSQAEADLAAVQAEIDDSNAGVQDLAAPQTAAPGPQELPVTPATLPESEVSAVEADSEQEADVEQPEDAPAPELEQVGTYWQRQDAERVARETGGEVRQPEGKEFEVWAPKAESAPTPAAAEAAPVPESEEGQIAEADPRPGQEEAPANEGGVVAPDGIQFDYPNVKGNFLFGGNQAHFSYRLDEGTPVRRSPVFRGETQAEAIAQAVDWVRQTANENGANDSQRRVLELQLSEQMGKVDGARDLVKSEPLVDMGSPRAAAEAKPAPESQPEQQETAPTFPTTLEAVAPKGRANHIYAEHGGMRYYLGSVRGNADARISELRAQFPDVPIYSTDRADTTSINGQAAELQATLEPEQQAEQQPEQQEETPPPTTDGSPEYEAAYQAAQEASRKYNAASEAYREGKIGDDEFLAAKAEYEAADAEFERVAQAESEREETPAADEEQDGEPEQGELDLLRRPGKRTGKKGRAGPFSATRQGVEGETREVPNSTAQMNVPRPDVKSSRNHQIWADFGLTPDEAAVLPIEQQFKIAVEMVKAKFGIKAITKDSNLQGIEAVEALMDAYVGMESLAYVLGANNRWIGGGELTLRLHKSKGEAMAYFSNTEQTIGMVRRNDSFAHEFGHKIDWDLAKQYAQDIMDKRGRALSGKIRTGGRQSEQLPKTVKEAFGRLLGAMFFNDAQLAAELLMIETALADEKTPKGRRKVLEARRQRLEDGAARPKKGEESTYYKISKAIDGAMGAVETDGGDGYWQRPTEMLARAFEAWIAHLVEVSEVVQRDEFITMKSRLYTSTGSRFMGVAYPKAEDRVAIFKAFDELISIMREEGIIEPRTEADPVQDAIDLIESMPLDKKTEAKIKKQARSFRTEARKRKRLAGEQEKSNQLKLRQAEERLEAAGKRVSALNIRMLMLAQNAEHAFMGAAYTIRGMLFSMRDRYPNSQGIQQLIEWFATDPGSGQGGGAKYEWELRSEVRKVNTKLKDIDQKTGISSFSDKQIELLMDLLTDESTASRVTELRQSREGREVVRAAGAMRRMMNDIYNQAQSSGIDIGYVGNYMKRMISKESIQLDREGFLRAALVEYRAVFERDFGSPDTEINLDDFLAEMAERIRKGDELFDTRKEIEKRVQELEDARAEVEADPDAEIDIEGMEAELNALIEDVYETVQDGWAAEAAQLWHDNILGISTRQVFSAPRGPTAKSTKPRQLTESADRNLKNYLIRDPMELLTTYALQMARLRIYSDFFGGADGNKAPGWKLAETLAQIRGERVLETDVEHIERAVELMTGKYRTVLTKAGLKYWAGFNSMMVPFVMSRAIFSQLAEPVTIALRDGNPLSIPGVFGMQIQDIASLFPGVKPESARWRREMGEFLGIYTEAMAEEIMNSRFNLLYQSIADSRRLSKFFIVSLIHPHAMSMRRAAMSKAFEYIPKIARRAMENPGKAKGRAAMLALNDIGIYTMEEVESAAKINKGMTPAQMDALPGFQKLNSAIVRFVDEAVQDPKVVDKPRLATQPEFSYIYGLLSFNSAFQRNVLRRSAKWIRTLWNDAGKTEAVKAAASLSVGYGVLMYAQYMALMGRMALFGGKEYWDELDDVGKGMALLSRTGILGLLDPAVNSVAAVKYRRGLSEMLAGPYLATWLSVPTRAITSYQNKDSSSNLTRYKGLEATYDLAAIMAIKAMLDRVPMAGAFSKATGAGIMFGTSKAAREGAADAAGEALGMESRGYKKDVPLRFQ